MEELKDSFGDYSSLLIGNALAMLVGLVNMFLMTRFLGPAGLGTFSLMLLTVNLAFIFSVNWTNAALLRYGKEEHLKTGRLNTIFWARTSIVLPIVAIAMVSIFIFKSRISDYVGISGKLFYFIPVWILVLGFSSYLKYMFQAVRGIRQFALIIFLEKFFVMIGILVFSLAVFKNNLMAVVLANCVGFFLAPALVGLKFPARILLPVRIDPVQIKRVMVFSYSLLFGSIGVYISNWVDLMIINHYQTKADVGIYSLSYRFMTVTQQFVLLIIPLITPMIISLYTQDNKEAIKRYMRRFVPQGIFFWSLLLCLGIIVCRGLVPRIFGQQFEGAIVPLSILFMALGMNLLSCFSSPIILTYELLLPLQIFEVVAAVVNLVVDLILVPRIGIAGAAVGTVCAFSVGGLGAFIIGNRIHGTFSLRQIVPISLVGIICLLSALIHSYIFYPIAVITLVICVVLLLKTFHLFEKGDEDFLNQIKMPDSIRKVAVGIFVNLSRLS